MARGRGGRFVSSSPSVGRGTPVTSESILGLDVQDRCRGLMVGLGVGNLLGVPQEGWPRYAVEASFPNGIRDIEVEPGEPDDDDLAQAIILAEAAIEAGSADLDVEETGRRFWRWAEENGRGIGIQTAGVLARIGGASPRCARGVDGTGMREAWRQCLSPLRAGRGSRGASVGWPTGPGSRAPGLGRIGQVLSGQRRRHAVRAASDPLDTGRRRLGQEHRAERGGDSCGSTVHLVCGADERCGGDAASRRKCRA